MTDAIRRIVTVAAVAAAAVLSTVLFQPVRAADAEKSGPALSAEDQTCLGCHGQEGMSKTFAKGKPLSLHVDGQAFAASVHGPLGCVACHSDVDLSKHPGSDKSYASARAFSIAKAGVCSQCHEDKAKLFAGSIHASVLREGNLAAPVCTDCHGAHAVVKGAAEKNIPCRKCHEAIYNAYLQSPHGKALGRPGAMKAPVCADCHHAHDVSPAFTSAGLRHACLHCHKDAVQAHQKWLPNTNLHLQVVSCPACHAPTSRKRVDLRLYDLTTKRDVTSKDEQVRFHGSTGIDAAGDVTPLDSKTLSDLLRGVDRDRAPGRITLVGRLEVRNGVEAHELTDKSKAIRDCVVCHSKGAAPFKDVSISIIGPDGRPIRYEAKPDVLHGPGSVESVSGFYAIGGTRIGVLDILLALALLAGISAPIAHLVLRRLLRKNRSAQQRSGAQGK